VPLTAFQRELQRTLAASEGARERYLAGGAALHFSPSSLRFSDELDFSHDTVAQLARAFEADRLVLETGDYQVAVGLSIPGFIRAIVSRNEEATRVDWARDSAWRFMPLVRDPLGGFLLHPVDLAVNKILVLAGRDEAQDFVDALVVHRHIRPWLVSAGPPQGRTRGSPPSPSWSS